MQDHDAFIYAVEQAFLKFTTQTKQLENYVASHKKLCIAQKKKLEESKIICRQQEKHLEKNEFDYFMACHNEQERQADIEIMLCDLMNTILESKKVSEPYDDAISKMNETKRESIEEKASTKKILMLLWGGQKQPTTEISCHEAELQKHLTDEAILSFLFASNTAISNRSPLGAFSLSIFNVFCDWLKEEKMDKNTVTKATGKDFFCLELCHFYEQICNFDGIKKDMLIKLKEEKECDDDVLNGFIECTQEAYSKMLDVTRNFKHYILEQMGKPDSVFSSTFKLKLNHIKQAINEAIDKIDDEKIALNIAANNTELSINLLKIDISNVASLKQKRKSLPKKIGRGQKVRGQSKSPRHNSHTVNTKETPMPKMW
ncbi:MAG: hypothetical protein ACX932_07395 [Gammaproteobacteria bacterium]